MAAAGSGGTPDLLIVSKFKRKSGFVFERHRLNRQSSKARLAPSVLSIKRVSALQADRTFSIAVPAVSTLKLISPKIGNAANRSSTQSSSENPERETSSEISNHGIKPLSQ